MRALVIAALVALALPSSDAWAQAQTGTASSARTSSVSKDAAKVGPRPAETPQRVRPKPTRPVEAPRPSEVPPPMAEPTPAAASAPSAADASAAAESAARPPATEAPAPPPAVAGPELSPPLAPAETSPLPGSPERNWKRELFRTSPEIEIETFRRLRRSLEDLGTPLIIVILLLCWVVARLARAGLSRLSSDGLLPRVFRIVLLAARIVGAVFALALLVVWLPALEERFYVWMLIALTVIALWSARDLLPDIMARAILTFERRIRPGVWVSGKSFSGIVEAVGIRATRIRDSVGHEVAVPNRFLLSGPVVSDDERWPVQELTVRLTEPLPPDRIRAALHDAALVSPWTPVETSPKIFRDSIDPTRWRIRLRVLQGSYAGRLEGEFQELVEEMLTTTAPRGEERVASAPSAPAKS